MYVKPPTPYCGFAPRYANGKQTQLYVPDSAAHVIVTAPTETGKTRRVLAPAACLWGGPAVVVSSKDDLMQLVMERRYGPRAVIDLRPILDPYYPEGVQTLIFDPTTTITHPVEALALADTIMQMATVGFGSGADQVSDGGVWESQASGPLAAFLFAASPHPHGNGKGMNWVLRAVDNINPEDSTSPGWVQAAAQCREYETLAIGMLRILDMEAKQRDSVAITMRKAITPWLRQSLMRHLDATPAFDPVFLDDPQATLFVLAPADGTVAGAAVTLLDGLVRRWRDKTSRREQMHRLLMVIDELPNTAPIPNLSKYVGEGRGLGINLVAAVQASCQLDRVYGRDIAHELRTIFPAAVVMHKARERELLEAAEDWPSMTTRYPESYGQADGHKGLTPELGPMVRWQELLPPDENHARLLIRGGMGTCVQIPDWLQFRDRYDQVVNALLHKTSTAAVNDPAAQRKRALSGLRRMWADHHPRDTGGAAA